MMQFPHPPAPQFAPEQSATVASELRYEDLAQDGRIMPIALPPTLSGLWRTTLVKHEGARNALATGVMPILTRLTLSTLDQPIRVDRPIETHAGFELAHARDGDGVTRLFLLIWSDVRGMAGRVGPRQADGALVPAGRLFAEHTFTRPLAPPDQRRVTRFDVAGYPEIPEARYEFPAPTSAGALPANARWLDDLAPDPTPIVFTLDQTDSNQHVNSLVYIRVFLDAAQRRLATAGERMTVRSRAVDIAYRKPCFAGDRVHSQVRLFDAGGLPGAAGLVAGDDGKPRCYVRVLFGT
ncbi:MAG: hypothetical protein M3619_22200 [Myxococcota bacterium]|nr:hypothetical protein [Myxococcota bacterium]